MSLIWYLRFDQAQNWCIFKKFYDYGDLSPRSQDLELQNYVHWEKILTLKDFIADRDDGNKILMSLIFNFVLQDKYGNFKEY